MASILNEDHVKTGKNFAVGHPSPGLKRAEEGLHCGSEFGLHRPEFNSQCYLVTSFAVLAPLSCFTLLVSKMGMIIAATPGGGCEGLHKRAHLGCAEPCSARYKHSVNISAGYCPSPLYGQSDFRCGARWRAEDKTSRAGRCR